MLLDTLKKPWLRAALLLVVSLAFSLRFYADLLPDARGPEFCARYLGHDPRAHGAQFRKQWHFTGAFWWKAFIYRYDMSAADYARFRQELAAENWSFCRDGDGIIGTLVSQHYPVNCLEDELEVGYSPVIGNFSYSMTYSYTDECLYIEQHFGL